MTALDIFRECAATDARIERIRERIDRRRALASGCTARPLSPDGGSVGGGDASMRMINYVSEIQTLEEDYARQLTARESYRSCCLYLADLLSDCLASVALRTYLEHQGTKAIATAVHVSQATVRRYKRQADDELRKIEITYWDRSNVPIYTLR